MSFTSVALQMVTVSLPILLGWCISKLGFMKAEFERELSRLLLLKAALCATKEHDTDGKHKYIERDERNRSVEQRLLAKHCLNNRKTDKAGITKERRKAIRALCSLRHTKSGGDNKSNNNRHNIHDDRQAHERKRIGNARQLHIIAQRRREHPAPALVE